jgi:hypothetical protein
MNDVDSRAARRRVLIQGACIVLATALVGSLVGTLGLWVAWPLLVGAAIGLVPAAGGDLGRAGAVGVGLLAGWFGFALRATVLPDIALGRGLGLAIPVVVVVVVALVSAERWPLWAGLGGVAAFVGTYTAAYADNPTAFLAESPTAFSTALVAVSAGLLVGLALRSDRPDTAPVERRSTTVPEAPVEAEATR